MNVKRFWNIPMRPRRTLKPMAFASALLAFCQWTVCAHAQIPARQEIALGRLFYTPQQREELDRRRALNIQEAVVTVENQYTINGRVSRSGGRSTTWINGSPQNDAFRSNEAAVIPMPPADGGKRIDVKVGQTLETGSGEITDRLQGGVIRIQRPPRAAP